MLPPSLLNPGRGTKDAVPAAEDAAVIVSGVKNFEDMLNAKVKAVSPAAATRGVTAEMTGKEALLKLI